MISSHILDVEIDGTSDVNTYHTTLEFFMFILLPIFFHVGVEILRYVQDKPKHIPTAKVPQPCPGATNFLPFVWFQLLYPLYLALRMDLRHARAKALPDIFASHIV